MAWALAHAVKNKMDRVIVAIPYTSIITQAATIYKEIFGKDNVVEHHSNIDENSLTQKSKLAIENWDAPIVVTTNVQLFESLYANKPSKCRKLHNLANSIIILDEVQMLPPEFLDPILSVLTGLVKNFGVSTLLSTATQPALKGKLGTGKHSFEGIDPDNVTELIDNPEELSNTLRRVTIKMPPVDMPVTEWGELQQDLEQHDQILCIVNTRKECKELYDLMPEDTIHLSRMMCTAHIMDTIQEIKQKLRVNVPVRVISTQLIEAGVDIDFPIVYRALTGLDSIAQSAGRCNREGRFEKESSYTRVFCSPKGTPAGLMRRGSDAMHQLLASDEDLDFLSPEAFQKYFQLFYSKIENFDKPQFRELLVEEADRMRFQFGTMAKNFRLIDDKGAKAIMVEYKDGANYIEQFKRNGPDRWLMRKMQRYTVSLNQYDFEKIVKTGLIEEVHGYYVQSGEQLYHNNTGLVYANEWLEEVHII
jgi:CRISPR-associated endonuclease/helicase Cas3